MLTLGSVAKSSGQLSTFKIFPDHLTTYYLGYVCGKIKLWVKICQTLCFRGFRFVSMNETPLKFILFVKISPEA